MLASGQKLMTSALARPRTRAGIISPIAALIAEYSAPTPIAVSRRNKMKMP